MSENTQGTNPTLDQGGLQDFFDAIRARLQSIVSKSDSDAVKQVAEGDYAPKAPEGDAINLGDPLIVFQSDDPDKLEKLQGEQTNVIIARSGGDTLIGFGSLDILLGTAAIDTTDYSYVSADDNGKGVFVDLGAGLSVTSGGDVDILSSIENVIGTEGDDVLLGSNVSNIFLGNGGKDIIDGRGEDDNDVVQLLGQAEDYDYTKEGDAIVITGKEGGDQAGTKVTLYNIEFVQFKDGSEGSGVKIFSATDGSAIAYDETVEVEEGNPGTDSAIVEFDLEATSIGVPGAVLVKSVTFGSTEVTETDGDGFLVIAGTYGTLKIDPADGSATYIQNEAADALNHDDAADGPVTDTFTYEVVGGDTAEVTIAIDPVNDAPVLEFKNPEDGILNIEELDNTTGSTDTHVVRAFIKVTDVDTDVSAANFSSSATLTDWDFSQLGDKGDDKVDIPGEIATWISQAEAPQTSVDPNEGTLGFKYTVADGELDLLAEGQTLTLTYEVKIWDTTGNADTVDPESATKTVTVIIEGSNDKPVITAQDVTHVVYEDDVHTDGSPLIEAEGSITVKDPDLKEQLDVVIEQASAAYMKSDGTSADLPVDPAVIEDLLAATNFTFNKNGDAGSTFDNKVKFNFKQDANKPLTFKYSYDAADDVDFLADGEKLVLTFPVTVSDSQDAEDSTVITLTIIGTNDAPVINVEDSKFSDTISEVSDSPVLWGEELSTSGDISFTDVDLSDENTVEVLSTKLTFNGEDDGYWGPSRRSVVEKALKEGFDIEIDDTSTDGTGTVSWSYAIREHLVDFLAKDESIVLEYQIAVKDPLGEAAYETVTVTIDGKNDAPEILGHVRPGSITEKPGQTGSESPSHHAWGSILIFDIDNTVKPGADGFTYSVGDAQWDYDRGIGDENDDPVPGELASRLTKYDLFFDWADELGRLDYKYKVDDDDLDFLGEGEIFTITYPVTITDPDGGEVKEDIIIKIVGTNDQPVISSVVADPAHFDETTDADPAVNDDDQHLEATGTITVADADYGDTLSASIDSSSVSWPDGEVPAASLTDLTNPANFTFTPVSKLNDPDDFNGDGAITLGFVYKTDVDLDFLGAGQTLTMTFNVVVSDDSGAANDTSVPVPVTITITGTNDVPVITVAEQADVEGLIIEDNSVGAEDDPLSATGTFKASDEDLTDNGKLEIAVLNPKGAFSNEGALTNPQVQLLTALLANELFTAELDENGTVTWNFAVSSSALNFLGQGDTIDVSYQVQIKDPSGATATQDVVITLKGVNDDVQVVAAEVAETTEGDDGDDGTQPVSAKGEVEVVDLDVGDELKLTVAQDAAAELLFTKDDGSTEAYSTLGAEVQQLIGKLVSKDFISQLSTDLDPDISNGSSTSIEFLYDANEQSIDFLAEGDVLELTYSAVISDGTKEVEQDIVVKITGTNDKPVVNAQTTETFNIVDGSDPDFNLLTDVVDAKDADHSDILSVESLSGQLDVSLDSLLGTEGLELSLSLEILQEAGVINVEDNGNVTFNDQFVEVMEQLGLDANLSGEMTVSDDSGNSANNVSDSAAFDLTIDFNAAGPVAGENPDYGTGEVIAVLDGIRSAILAHISKWWDETVRADLVKAIVQTARAQGISHSHAVNDLITIRQFVGSSGILPFFDGPWVPLFIAAIVFIHPMLGIVATVAAVLLVALAFINDRATRRKMEGIGGARARAQTTVDIASQHAETVHAMGMLPGVLQRFDRDNTIVSKATQQVALITASTSAISKFIRYTAQIGVLGLGAYLATLGEITAGGMIAASIIMGRALAPAEQAMSAWRGLVGTTQAHERLRKLFLTAPVQHQRTKQPLPKGHIVLKRATLFFPGSEKPILRDINLDLKPGQISALIGSSASGKSTLCKLVIGSLAPTSGSVRLDGAAIQNWDAEQLGKTVGYLAQNVQLLPGTVKENISRLGEGDDRLVVAAAQLAGCHDMINALPNGYETVVGPGGHNLSGGQAQRIGLARAIYGQPKLIVLDEPNANLDSDGEAALQSCVLALRDLGSTIIIVSHRPFALSKVDVIVTMKDGAIEKTQTATVELSSAAIATGQVSPDGSQRSVQHLEGGIVREIRVREGENVEAGQTLLTLDKALAQANYLSNRRKLQRLQIMRDRLLAEERRDGSFDPVIQPYMRQDRSFEQFVQTERVKFRVRGKLLEEQDEVYGLQQKQIVSEISSLEAQARGMTDQLTYIEQEIASKRVLLDKGLARMPDIFALERKRAELSSESEAIRSTIARARQKFQEIDIAKLSRTTEQLEKIAEELSDVNAEIAQTEEALNATTDILSRTEITAPIDGKILKINHKTIGGVVGPGEAIMVIIPNNEELIVDSRLSPSDIDNIEIGMIAKVQFSSFMARHMVPLDGQVFHIGADVEEDRDDGEKFYTVRVRVSADTLSNTAEKAVELVPGMPADVFIQTGSHTPLNYIFDPLIKSFGRAFREEAV
eukprot:g2159.t1